MVAEFSSAGVQQGLQFIILEVAETIMKSLLLLESVVDVVEKFSRLW
jgi:hypothetical protein